MSIRKRLFSGGLALAFGLTGWGFIGGAAPADAACNTVGNQQLCTYSSSQPGYREIGVIVAPKNPYGMYPPYTGVSFTCTPYGTAINYGVQADALTPVSLGSGLQNTVCPY